MFALLVNECDARKRDFVVEVALNFAIFSSDFTFRVSLACGAPGKLWTLYGSDNVRPASKRVDVLNELLDSWLAPRCAFVGTNRKDSAVLCEGNCVEVFNGRNSLMADVPPHGGADTMALLVRRAEHNPALWMGWYKEDGVDLVLVHTFQKAIVAATGCCGCLFDAKLQLSLVETGKLVLYELGAHSVKVMGVDEREEETTGAGS